MLIVGEEVQNSEALGALVVVPLAAARYGLCLSTRGEQRRSVITYLALC